MAANVRVGEAHLLVQTTGVAAIANVRVGEAVLTISSDTPPTSTPANVLVGEAKISFQTSPVTPTPAKVRVGEASLTFGSPPIVIPQRTGLWVYRGGALTPAFAPQLQRCGDGAGVTIDITETHESGVNGDLATTSNTTYGAVFGTAATQTISTDFAVSGTRCLKGTFSANTGGMRPLYTSRATTYSRCYIRFAALPAATTVVLAAHLGATQNAQIRITPTGTLEVRNGTTTVFTTTAAIATGAWYRLEWRVGSADQQLKLFLLHSTTALEDANTKTYSNGNNDRITFGNTASGTMTAYYDDVQTRDDAFPGPSVVIPAITSASSTTFTVGSAGTFTVTTSGTSPTLSKTGTLPSGVTFTDNGNGTATLAGTPGAGTGTTYPLTITATNAAGAPTQSFTLTVNQAPAITSSSSTTSVVGSAMTPFTVTTTGYPTRTITKTGSLPTGVTLTDNGDNTATISGTPGAATGAAYPITITAANGVGSNATQSFTLTNNQAPAITSASSTSATQGSAMTPFTVTTTGYPTRTITKTGSLPSGVTLVDNGNSTATISGTPTTASGSPYTITITAANAIGSNATQSFTLTVASTAQPGEQLVHALNRKAGTTGLDLQGAANAWAGTVGKDLLGALNAKNASTGYDLAKVLNALAGTTGLDVNGAAQHL
jgi:hypothetical protein